MVHHGAGLRRLTNDDELVEQLVSDWRLAEMSKADRAMFIYAVKLTQEPWHMEERDVAALREVGFSDAAVLDINQVTGYYAYANRLVDGLGVGLEGIHQKSDSVPDDQVIDIPDGMN